MSEAKIDAVIEQVVTREVKIRLCDIFKAVGLDSTNVIIESADATEGFVDRKVNTTASLLTIRYREARS